MTHIQSADAAGGARPFFDRPLVGESLLAIAALHIVAAPAVYPESLRSTWDAGVVGAVEADPALADRRGVGFWYVVAGVGVGLLGGVVREGEVRTGVIPRWFGWSMLGLAAGGATLMPRSGFWSFAVPGVLALRRRR
jgi:hypothetical protein